MDAELRATRAPVSEMPALASTRSLFLCGDVMTGRGIDQILRHPSRPILYEQAVTSALEYAALAEHAYGPIPRRVDPTYVWGVALEELDDEIASRASLAMENARLFAKARREATLRDDVLAIVSHDLRNPLATISMALARLETDRESTSMDRTRLVRVARDSVDWMEHMIQDLLDVANIDAGRLSIESSSIDLVVLLVEAETLFEQMFADHAITFRLDVPETLPSIRADHDRILQVLGNLLSNAAKFTPAGGQVTLSATNRGAEVVVSVRDTGPGIPAEDVPHLFDRFWHARRGATMRGTGLGLSIAKGIVDAHGGRIWVDTNGGSGTVFSFALPCAETSPAGRARASDAG